jgi:hypothetical protein
MSKSVLTNDGVIEAFVTRRGDNARSHNNNLRYSFCYGTLVNYTTVIARWNEAKKLEVNLRKYSRTTSKIQTQLLNAIKRHGLEYTTH